MLLFCTLSENRPGANRVTGKLAVKVAKLLGAGRVVAAGRNQEALSTLHLLGAEAIIRLDASAKELGEAFVREAGQAGFQVVIDYVWGRPVDIENAWQRDEQRRRLVVIP